MRNRNFNLFPVIAGIFILTNSLCFAQSQTILDQKLNLEKSIQERTERIVEKIIGSREMIVLVNVALAQEEQKGAAAPQQNRQGGYPGVNLQDEEYLPGITYSYMPGQTGQSVSTNIVIKKIDISITVAETVTNDTINKIKTEVTNLMGLNAVRGDAVAIQKIAFATHTMTLKEQFLSLGPSLYWLVGFVLLTIFMFGPLRSFFKTIVKSMEIRIEADTRLRGMDDAMRGGGPAGAAMFPGGGSLELNIGRRKSLPDGKEREQGPMKKFGFITRENLKNLIFLLKNEKPEKIAIISSYLAPDITSEILSSFPPEVQSRVVVHLTTPKVIDPQEVTEIETELKQKIDYLVGGEEYFLNLLDQVDRDSQENILKTLERDNPALAAKLKQSLFFFEDIVLLDKNVLQRVVREIQRQGLSLALSLKDAKEEVKQKVLDALTEGARAMLSEQIDLIGEVSPKRIQDEQKAIVNIIRDLEKVGDIVIDRTKKDKIIEAVEVEEVDMDKKHTEDRFKV